MRAALIVLALLAVSAPGAMAQNAGPAVQPRGVLQLQQTNILDGVWNVNGLSPLTLTTREGGLLEGELEGRSCHGQYQGRSFTLLCPSDVRGPLVLVGRAYETPPVATTARARVIAQPAGMTGQIFQGRLDTRAHLDEIAQLRGTRQ